MKTHTPPIDKLTTQAYFPLLAETTQTFLAEQTQHLGFSHEESRQLCEIALDLQMWAGDDITALWPSADTLSRKQVMQHLRNHHQAERASSNRYPEISSASKISAAAKPGTAIKAKLGLGYCPVASPRTRCCNLQTLDAVDNCGYGCSYCSIQSFFDGKAIRFDPNFADKLAALELDPDKTYHIGTGQSSDSLMWGNSHGVLDALIAFARANPNVILELKTKSANVSHLLKSDVPANILCTWSLNTPTLIEHEEHGTATLENRLKAARKIADKGGIVGFHFHPIIHYDRWQKEYTDIVTQLTTQFQPEEVALISLGTLTFIKPVMREIRQRGIQSQILKMTMENADGKLSYPEPLKINLFRHVYDAFIPTWKEHVFFYLCMENQRLWKPVFGYEHNSNDTFEAAMKTAYFKRITQPG